MVVGASIPQPDDRTDRRRANRAALRLNATIREGGRSRTQVRLIDISTHGCRIECTSMMAEDSWIWLGIAGLETQYCRVVWHCQEFVGLEFATPLAEAVLERLLQEQAHMPEKRSTSCAQSPPGPTGWRGRRATPTFIRSPSCRANARSMRWSRASG